MSVPILAFFNTRTGTGKTSLAYHLTWMLADKGYRVLAADLDPQANLTSKFLTNRRLEEIYTDGDSEKTIYRSVQPLVRGTGDFVAPSILPIDEEIGLLIGDPALSGFESELSIRWPDCNHKDKLSYQYSSVFSRMLHSSAESWSASLVLMDLGSNLNALNRAALIAADYIVIPLAGDVFSLQDLRNTGPAVRRWQTQWNERVECNPFEEISLPIGRMQPIGYVLLNQSIRLDTPARTDGRWMKQIPALYREAVLHANIEEAPQLEHDPHCIARLKDYRTLLPLSLESHKPMFFLKPADGALGAHQSAVAECYRDYEAVALSILERIEMKQTQS